MEDHNRTPWQRVYDKFGKSQSDLARALNCDRSKISRALSDPEGLINGRDQLRLISVAKDLSINLTADDMLPGGEQ